ncbi:hypothetical protein G6F62_013443 [Rhizopus arrhizus]|nr:hypothetical protein G6F62_013443 [Rhizopus arrhizus]
MPAPPSTAASIAAASVRIAWWAAERPLSRLSTPSSSLQDRGTPHTADGTVMNDSPYRTYRVGIGVSLVLAALIATLSLIAVATPNLGWGVVALATIALWVGLPLLLVLVLAWLRYMVRQRGRVPGRVHALMFVPTVAAMLIIPLWQSLQHTWSTVAGGSRDPIAERHINLSGQPLWLDTAPRHTRALRGLPPLPQRAVRCRQGLPV